MADSNTLMKELGAFVGQQFASVIGGATGNYNSLGKLEVLIKGLDTLVRGSDEGGDFDTLTQIKAFLTMHKNDILAIVNKLDKMSVVNVLTVTNDAANQGKALAAPQGKVLKDLIDGVTASVGVKADRAEIVSKAEFGTVAEFTSAFNTATGS